ncbi:MAG: hypothetical protein ACRBDI_00115 [Alphaproteobacteria bacterium]
MIRAALFTTLLLLLPVSAMAQEATPAQTPSATAPILMETPHKLETTKYSPDYCEFTANFPEEPIVNNYCEVEGDPSTCYNLISYTKVFDMTSSINIEIICNPATPQMYAEFTPEVMESTVSEMTKEKLIEQFNINTREAKGYRQTGLIGKGKKGLDDSIYLSQLWISESSIMSVEAEMSGAQSVEADKLFADILHSIGYTKEIETPTEEAPKETEEPKAP